MQTKTTQDWVDELKHKIDAKLAKGETFYKSTAPTNTYSWSVEEHMAMQKLAQHYLDEGCGIASKPAHGVTDWRIVPKVAIKK